MIAFTDERLYLKGTCQAALANPATGQIMFSSNKFQTAGVTAEVNSDPIRAGLGNPIAAIIPSDSGLSVDFGSAAFDLFVKGAQVGSTPTMGATVPVGKIVTATSETLTVDVSDGTPTPQYGYAETFCYVTEVGAPAPVAVYGTPYDISAAGEVSGFVATIGKKYQVWYFKPQVSAELVAISGNFDPGVFHFTAQMAVYANKVAGDNNSGTRVGWLDVIVPLLKLNGAGAGIDGSQTANDMTNISGQAIAFEETVVSETITDCASSNLAYYVYRPDEGASSIAGLAVIGGEVSVAASGTKQIPVKLVTGNGSLIDPPSYEMMAYEATGAPSGTTVNAKGVITAGAEAGDFDVTIKYPATGTAEQTTVVVASVVAAP